MSSINNSEADRLFKALFDYADEIRGRNVYDFTEIVGGFYKRLASERDNPDRNPITKRIMALMKNYVDTDPRYQMRIDEVLR